MSAPSGVSSHVGLEPVVFGTSIEALLSRAVRGRLDPPVLQLLSDLKIDLDRLAVAYEYLVWKKLLDGLVQHFYPGVPSEQAHYRLGQDYLRGLEHTLVGKALFAFARLAGPKKMLERMTRNVRTANNYLQARYEVGPDGIERIHYEVVEALLPKMKTLPPPSVGYFLGILQAGLEHAGLKEVVTEVESYDAERLAAVIRLRYRL